MAGPVDRPVGVDVGIVLLALRVVGEVELPRADTFLPVRPNGSHDLPVHLAQGKHGSPRLLLLREIAPKDTVQIGPTFDQPAAGVVVDGDGLIGDRLARPQVRRPHQRLRVRPLEGQVEPRDDQQVLVVWPARHLLTPRTDQVDAGVKLAGGVSSERGRDASGSVQRRFGEKRPLAHEVAGRRQVFLPDTPAILADESQEIATINPVQAEVDLVEIGEGGEHARCPVGVVQSHVAGGVEEELRFEGGSSEPNHHVSAQRVAVARQRLGSDGHGVRLRRQPATPDVGDGVLIGPPRTLVSDGRLDRHLKLFGVHRRREPDGEAIADGLGVLFAIGRRRFAHGRPGRGLEAPRVVALRRCFASGSPGAGRDSRHVLGVIAQRRVGGERHAVPIPAERTPNCRPATQGHQLECLLSRSVVHGLVEGDGDGLGRAGEDAVVLGIGRCHRREGADEAERVAATQLSAQDVGEASLDLDRVARGRSQVLSRRELEGRGVQPLPLPGDGWLHAER